MTRELWRLTAHEAHELLRRREITSVELTESVLRRIEAVEPAVHAYITITAELALQQAREADERFAAGAATPLTGIPVAVEGGVVTQGVRTPAGARRPEDFIPPDGWPAGARGRRARAVIGG